ncbi:type I-F CRISPR-associated protein Csy1 [Aliikangiella maris]|uniref:Type I-F CRISPR-associated protein Csy1 n=2 Tax=Aliikangiella maris TaxID=3162458 RepID=A0ABV2BSD2_9GAMM
MQTQLEESLSTKIVDYIQIRASDKLEKLEKEINKLTNSEKNIEQSKLENLQQKYKDEQEKFKPANWLTDAASRAKQIQLVTHALKYIHGDAKGSNIFYQTDNSLPSHNFVSTASLNNPVIDIVGNAAALDVGRLLMQVTHEGKNLVDYILSNDISPLMPIAENQQQAEQWFEGFKQVFSSDVLASHKLAKQVYWPIDDCYHLLSPLFASSFAQSIYDKRKDLREVQFNKDETVKNNGFSVFSNLAVQTFGGTKPQNISQLNSQRGGKNYLLDARPPTWNTIEKPPFNTESIFLSVYRNKAYKRVKKLQKYLELKFERDSTIEIREYRRSGVDDLIEILLSLAASIHAQPAGWSMSEECQLSLEEQLWLDPKRAEFDQGFKEEMEKKEWHDKVAARFASWLNAMLESKKLALGDVEHKEWTVLVARQLRLTERARKEFY